MHYRAETEKILYKNKILACTCMFSRRADQCHLQSHFTNGLYWEQQAQCKTSTAKTAIGFDSKNMIVSL